MQLSKTRVAVGLVLVVAVVATVVLKMATDEDEGVAPRGEVASRANALQLAPEVGVVELVVSQPVELDFKSKEEIYEIRRAAVALHPGLVANDYEPAAAVFGRIGGGKAWWGMLGLYHFANGNKSIEGPSEESRMLLNPFVLLYIQESRAVRASDMRDEALTWEPTIQRAVWTTGKSPTLDTAWDMTRYFEGRVLAREPGRDAPPTLTISNLNARDFGFRFFDLDATRSTNVVPAVASSGLRPTRNYIHVGRSCGYPGGCNNASPTDRRTDFQVTRLPARATFKLWKAQGASPSDPPDAVQVMTFE